MDFACARLNGAHVEMSLMVEGTRAGILSLMCQALLGETLSYATAQTKADV